MAATGLVSHPGEDIPLQPAEDPAGVTLGPVGRMLDEPFPGHSFEIVGRPLLFCSLLCFAVLTGIDLSGQQLAGHLTPPSDFF